MDTFNTSENIIDKRGICYDETFSIENSQHLIFEELLKE